ncbi:mediator of RNA polymerase II transcription subunit 14 [Diospyros lotus]|uniref:mediator of RNA polymerase II transcription subunit 14 n=1 Tax=Diospyros lotus TaxID=55363 RepID=UPI00225865D2|nr:mediator of RNA polymerase II transcription subunit 14 [Diospyros lotus]XP_052194040.1 mediator of RNA polymerase II transcription subunit 14 [Diospyros lotus]XP_052194041.1 mediator of RNA polymerase II transcription subunit 14 [Diospyros lotus]
MEMGEIGQQQQQTVEFSTLVSRAAEESYLSLKELVEKSKSRPSEMSSDSEKKIDLLKFLVKTQQRMLRLNVLAKWCQQVPLIQYCQQLGSVLSNHDMCFTQSADSLFFMHERLQQARAPIYDVPSAIEVLLTGNYQRLPKCVGDVGIQSTLTEDEQKPALKKLDILVRSKLLEVTLPAEISEVSVSDGTVMLHVDGEFKVLVTLGYRGHLSMWRILHMELLVGEKCGFVKLEELRRHVLGDDLERRMAAAENPFIILYSVLHELCVALVMDTVIRQVQSLRQGRWKDAIRFELISDGSIGQGGSSSSTQMAQDGEADSAGLRTPGLKVLYWLDFDKTSGTSDSGSCPFIKIEPGSDLRIKCLHSTFVVDPLTDKEAEFSLDQSCIDVEKLLLRAICCNRYTRLLEIYKELAKNAQICRASSDVVLQCHSDEPDGNYKKKDKKVGTRACEGQEVLRVRAYGSSFFTLGINIRNGRFHIHSSRNILNPLTLVECEEALNQGTMTAAEVFMSLRSKSILHLFARIARFIGLMVYEHGYAAVKVPKNILNGPSSLLMGFPDCGSSYFLLMQLDKDFKPLFKLLETQSDSSGKAYYLGDINNVVRIKNVDISQIQMLEDEINLSLLDCRKVLALTPNAVGNNQTHEQSILSELSLEGSLFSSGNHSSSFSSIVDEVFELERGSSAQSFSAQSLSSSLSPSASHFGSLPMNFQSLKAGTSSPMWEGGISKVSSGSPHYNGSAYPLGNLKGIMLSGSGNSPSSGPGRSTTLKKLSASKSEQDLASLRSPHSTDSCNTMDEDDLIASGNRSSRLLSPPRLTGPRVSAPTGKPNVPKSSTTGTAVGSFKVSRSSSWATTTVFSAQVPDIAVGSSPSLDAIARHDKRPRKRSVSDMLSLVPSLGNLEVHSGFHKRRRIAESGFSQQTSSPQALILPEVTGKTECYSYASLIAEANKGNAPSGIYVSALLHVVRHCSLCIKHARLTSQMDALDIPYVEEVGLRNASSNLWFRLPFAAGNTWKHICLRLGRPGSMHWDVKINDQHFRDLWELQKGSKNTPWGSGVRIANTSDVDSHIRYDSEGVVLSYHSVDTDSIKKLVADIQRLSNARMFALGMRRLLGVRPDEKLEEGGPNSDGKVPTGVKGVPETADKFSEQMRRAFRIEEVGLTSFWFSFGSAVLARFVVEWESGKEGCTMHVSPDQLWPHTKFLEDFINGAEVASFLDCIRLTAGPLHALAAATRPARAGPASAVPGVTAAISSMAKQSGYIQAQGHLQGSPTTNATQATSGPGGNPVGSATMSSFGNHNLHGAAMLAAAGRGGPGIVPSSLLPIDVSVVLRGPYWIRIIYRKFFAVDMRCFAGDQVWLQPATPPKEGPSTGGSLPCPQFRPFIMEHVAQELNGLDTNFTGSQQGVGLANANIPNPSSASQLSNSSGNRINIPGSGGLPRSGNQGSGLSRMGNALSAISSLPAVSAGLPIRRSSGAGVPAHVRGELNTAIIGLGDDGGYGGGWVPLVALKKVLRGILKYLGVLWLFAQLPALLKEILGSILKDNEGALLNLDQEQPALRFFVGGYVFAVSVHRVQLLLQVLSVKRFHHSQQQQQQQNAATAQEELTQSEISEICDYFSRRVASEPYDASRVASFITLLTLPISVLREFLKLIAWKKGLAQVQGGDTAPTQKPRIELCLENHAGLNVDGSSENLSASKSNIHYDRAHNSVDFALTVVLDPTHIPLINAAGGAAWLPYCVSVRLKYLFGENPSVIFLSMEGSHGGRACWLRFDDWEKCKQRVARTVEVSGCSAVDVSQGRLRIVADSVQRTLHMCLQALRDGGPSASSGTT